jgi:outer membrane protein TolC
VPSRRTRRTAAGAVLAVLVFGLLGRVVAAQTAAPSQTFKLADAVAYALSHHPALRTAAAQHDVAQLGVPLAETAYLPRLDLLWQTDRASTNNIVATTLPQSLLPAVSGPVLPSTTWSGAWNSAAGLLFSWEPVDFGYRRATVDAAQTDADQAAAQLDVTRLQIGSVTVDAFLALVAAQQITKAADANVTRWDAVARSVRVLVDNQLRPGADASRADAELAIARSRLIQAQTVEERSRAILSEALGLVGARVDADPGGLVTSSPAAFAPAALPASHPLALSARFGIDQARARERAADRAYAPRLLTQFSFSGKGSGTTPAGIREGGAAGLGLERGNWAAGLQITLPVFDYFAVHDRRGILEATERAASARYDETTQRLASQLVQAQAGLDGARRLAANTPIELEAARATEGQTTVRYQAGLATLVDVSQAESLLVQAEIDDNLARINVWRSLAVVAAAAGDLQPFLDAVRGAGRP